MKIAVLLKFFQGELNPFDGAALECALEWGAEVTAVSMAPPSTEEALKNIARLGVRTVLISDPLFVGSDTQATSYVLAKAIERINPDMIFAGRQSMDGDTAQVPPMLAERLGMEIVPGVMEFDRGKTKTRSGVEAVLTGTTVVTFERIRTLRFPSIFSPKGTVEIWNNATLMADEKKCGLQGSPTRVLRSYESTVGRRSCRFFEAADFDALIKEGLSEKVKNEVTPLENRVEKIYYVGNIAEIAQTYAKTAIRLDPCGKSAKAFSDELHSLGAKIVLFESREEYKILAARSAVITGAGICADCVSFRQEKGAFVMTRPALGGNVTADIVSRAEMSFATVRPLEMRDGDIIFSVGRGAIDHLGEIQDLAEKYGARLACTRFVADSGIMPYRYQVGVTGKTVSPRIYVAFGISGAVQHTCAITGAGRILAVNTDKSARIFDYSDFGIVANIEDLFHGKQ